MHDKQFEIISAYIHGRIEAQIEAFAETLNIPKSQLTNRLGTLLLSNPQPRDENSMRILRRKTAKTHKPVRKVAVDSNARKNSTRKTASRKVGRPKKKVGYWASMTPEQRSEEMKRRLNIRKAA